MRLRIINEIPKNGPFELKFGPLVYFGMAVKILTKILSPLLINN